MREYEELAMFLCHLCYLAEALQYVARYGETPAFAVAFRGGNVIGVRSIYENRLHQRSFDTLAMPLTETAADMVICFTVNYFGRMALYELTGSIPGTRNHFACWEHTFALPIAENA